MPRGFYETSRRKDNGRIAWRDQLTRKFYDLEREFGTTEAVVRVWKAGRRAAYDTRRPFSRANANYHQIAKPARSSSPTRPVK